MFCQTDTQLKYLFESDLCISQFPTCMFSIKSSMFFYFWSFISHVRSTDSSSDTWAWLSTVRLLYSTSGVTAGRHPAVAHSHFPSTIRGPEWPSQQTFWPRAKPRGDHRSIQRWRTQNQEECEDKGWKPAEERLWVQSHLQHNKFELKIWVSQCPKKLLQLHNSLLSWLFRKIWRNNKQHFIVVLPPSSDLGRSARCCMLSRTLVKISALHVEMDEWMRSRCKWH